MFLLPIAQFLVQSIAGDVLVKMITSRKKNTQMEGFNMADIIKMGDSGPGVEQLQRDLNAVGLKISVDGVFGPETRSAVMSFQRTFGVDPVDGIVGYYTATAIKTVLEERTTFWETPTMEVQGAIREIPILSPVTTLQKTARSSVETISLPSAPAEYYQYPTTQVVQAGFPDIDIKWIGLGAIGFLLLAGLLKRRGLL